MDDLIRRFRDYQIEWLTAHNDIEFCKEEEKLIIGFLKDTAESFMRENQYELSIAKNHFSNYSPQVVELAFMVAWHLVTDGIDITEKHETAVQQKEMLDRAYVRGRHDERKACMDAKEAWNRRVPMDDVIYRQDVIDEINRVIADYIPLLIGKTEGIPLTLAKAIKNIPSAQQWIPCSERLPEEGAPVLGSFEVEGDRFILPTSIFVFDEEEGKSWTGTMGLKPIAWMPLPEPYRGECDG